jgi:hypothetical protein
MDMKERIDNATTELFQVATILQEGGFIRHYYMTGNVCVYKRGENDWTMSFNNCVLLNLLHHRGYVIEEEKVYSQYERTQYQTYRHNPGILKVPVVCAVDRAWRLLMRGGALWCSEENWCGEIVLRDEVEPVDSALLHFFGDFYIIKLIKRVGQAGYNGTRYYRVHPPYQFRGIRRKGDKTNFSVLVPVYEQRLEDIKSGKTLIGPPQASDSVSIEQMKKCELVGLYKAKRA